MPNIMVETESYEGDSQVLASHNGMRSPRMITIDLDSFAASAGGAKILYPGTVIARIPGSNKGRAIGGELTTAITTSSTEAVVQDAGVFKVGDSLVVTAPYARIDLAATWANNDTLEVEIDGVSVTHTVSGYSTLTALATAIAQTLNQSALTNKAEFIAEAQYIHIFGANTYAASVTATTAGDGTGVLANSATALESGLTVETVDGVDTSTNTLSLASTADRRLPAGAPIGVAGGEIMGLVISYHNLSEDSNDVACYTSCSVYGDRLRGWSKAMQQALPEITLV